MSIRTVLEAPTYIEPSATVRLRMLFLDLANITASVSALQWTVSQTAGNAVTFDSATGYGNGEVAITAPANVVAGGTVTIQVSVTDGTETEVVTVDITPRDLIDKEILRFIHDIQNDAFILPGYDWSFELDLVDPSTLNPLDLGISRSLDPTKLSLKLDIEGQEHVLPAIVQPTHPDKWTIHVVGVTRNEQIIQKKSEKIEVLSAERPYLNTIHPIMQIKNIYLVQDGHEEQLIEPPHYEYDRGTTSVTFDPIYKSLVDNNQINRVRVEYFHEDETQKSGWYAESGLGPFDSRKATLQVQYGTSVGAENAQIREAYQSMAPVIVGGSAVVRDYHHVWMQDGDSVLLRESYEGIMRT